MFMKIQSWLKSSYPAPKTKEIMQILFCIALPNLFFLAAAAYTATSRPLLDIDYLFALFFLLIPWSGSRILGGLFFIAAVFFDVLMLVIQIFPFMDFAAIHYLLPFVSVAPVRYIAAIAGLIICSGLILWINLYLTRPQKILYPQFIIVLLLIFSYPVMILGFTYAEFKGILGRDNYYIAHSQSRLYHEITQSYFWEATNVVPKLMPLSSTQPSAAQQLHQPFSPKILYIVAESWGQLRNAEAQKNILAHIDAQQHKLAFIEHGTFQTSGATVAGELRELCTLALENDGFALKKIAKSQFEKCLPNQLRNKGYQTYALHGTSGLLYDRTDWYKKAGFQHTWFGENFMGLRRCTAFKGVCDSELMKEVGQTFKETKKPLFFYWMTLTSHQPYSKKDIHNHRFDCQKYNMKQTGDACHNAQLQTQFFDDLAYLIQKPEMQGVEVMVVGDHQPPVWGEEIQHIKPLTVSYLHFKVKAVQD
nr:MULTISPECIES: sulfatase-like hydrolase/transferase [unclassified Acinetobacter]